MKKENLSLIISLALIVPIWGTFYGLIGIQNSWPAFASAAVFFASEKGVKGSWKIGINHVIGVLWGVIFLKFVDVNIFSARYLSTYIPLLILTVLAVLVIRIKWFDHLPSLFSGWAITVGVLGNMPINEWNLLPIDTVVSILGGVFFIGFLVSVIQGYLNKVIKI